MDKTKRVIREQKTRLRKKEINLIPPRDDPFYMKSDTAVQNDFKNDVAKHLRAQSRESGIPPPPARRCYLSSSIETQVVASDLGDHLTFF